MLGQLSPQQIGLIVAAIFVVLSLFVYGLKDVARFSLSRAWAIGSVVFRESIRKRILWLAPVAMLVVVGLSQFIVKSIDPADSIRQTIQFTLFASGFLVTIASVVLACTNLPRDIESKVVFTVVTKPVTRLEIVLGKIVGFTRVTGTLLIVMGVFAFVYVEYRSIRLNRAIESKLADPSINEFDRQWLQHQKAQGLLTTRVIDSPVDLQQFALIDPVDRETRWFGVEQQLWIPFSPTPEQMTPKGVDAQPGEGGFYVALKLKRKRVGDVEQPLETPKSPLGGPTLFDRLGEARYGPVGVTLSVFDVDGNQMIPSPLVNEGKRIILNEKGEPTQMIHFAPKVAMAIAQQKGFYLVLGSANSNYVLGAPARGSDLTDTIHLIVPGTTEQNTQHISSVKDFVSGQGDGGVRGPDGRFGQQLIGPSENRGTSLGRYRFDMDSEPVAKDGRIPLELRFGIERAGDEPTLQNTDTMIEIVNRTTGEISPRIPIALESNRTAFITAPAEYFKGGKFDILVYVQTPGRIIGLESNSIGVVRSTHWFASNLTLAMFSQWMLSALVVTIGLFCSTFLSWPIAIVTTLMIVTGRWMVNQASESLQPGIGSQIAESIGGNYKEMRVIANTFEGLAQLLKTVADFLPDVGAFGTGQQIERMVAIPISALGGGGLVLLIFGLPLLVGAYVILRNREVAP